MRDHAGGTPPPEQRQVRPTEPEDDCELMDLRRETWTSTYGPILGDGALQAMLRDLDRGTTAMLPGRSERGHALVGRQRIVGSAVAAGRGAVAYLWGMYVRPAQQHRGAGSQLLAAVVRNLDLSVWLEARVLTASVQARTCHQARGCRLVGQGTTELVEGVDATTLVLRVEVERLRAMLG